MLVLDGQSTDDTLGDRRIDRGETPRVRLLDNPARIVPKGLNLAIAKSVGDVIWIDGHCEIAPDL